jgi:hypothetical protein
MNFSGITVFTDRYITNNIVDRVQSKIKIAWLLESKAINPYMYQSIKQVENKFDYILTHDEELSCKHNEYLISYDVFKLLINKSYNGKRYWDTMSLYYALSHKINNADNSALKFWLELLDY